MEQLPPSSPTRLPPHSSFPEPASRRPRPEYPAIFPPLSSAYSISSPSTSARSSFPPLYASTSSQSPPFTSGDHLPPFHLGALPLRRRSRSPTLPEDTHSTHDFSTTRHPDASLSELGTAARVSSEPFSAGAWDSSALKPFVSKLWFLLKSPMRYGDLIAWDASGTTVLVAHQHPRFITELLPLVFAHSSVSAFRRQLNIYSFTHLSATDLIPFVPHSSLDVSDRRTDVAGWTHPSFTRDDPATLPLLVPRISRARRLLQMAKEKRGERRGEREEE